MEAEIEKTLSSLRSRHINGIFAENHAEAIQKILALIPTEAILAIGDSTSMRQLGILQALRKRGSAPRNSESEMLRSAGMRPCVMSSSQGRMP